MCPAASLVCGLTPINPSLPTLPHPTPPRCSRQNWGPSDGAPPLPGGWTDAWQYLYSGDAGLTYDPKTNPMLKAYARPIRRRLDRLFCRLRAWRLHAAELVGRQPLPGLQHEGRPVLPSDHFGLLVTLHPAAAVHA